MWQSGRGTGQLRSKKTPALQGVAGAGHGNVPRAAQDQTESSWNMHAPRSKYRDGRQAARTRLVAGLANFTGSAPTALKITANVCFQYKDVIELNEKVAAPLAAPLPLPGAALLRESSTFSCSRYKQKHCMYPDGLNEAAKLRFHSWSGRLGLLTFASARFFDHIGV